MAVSAAQSSPSRVPEADSWTETDFSLVKFTHRWTVYKFSNYLQTLEVLESPPFSSGEVDDNLVWCIKIKILTSKTTMVYINMVLLSGTDSEVRVQAQRSILGDNQEKKHRSTYTSSFQKLKVGEEYHMSGVNFSDLSNPSKGLLPGGNLTLYWEIAVQRTDKPQITEGKKLTIRPGVSDGDELCHDFGSLLKDGLFTDVTIAAGGKEFKAHKGILSTRSPVFRAMFEHNMQENVENRVTIEDLSPELLREMLTFIYTGRSPNLKTMPGDLLRVADKYDLKRLKAWSEKELADQLSPENLVDTLLLADQHSATELTTVCMELFTTHAAEVVKTEKWPKLAQNHELLAKVVVKLAKR